MDLQNQFDLGKKIKEKFDEIVSLWRKSDGENPLVYGENPLQFFLFYIFS